MSHAQQRAYTESVRDRFPDKFIRSEVVEVGSMSINGDCNHLFQHCAMIRLDVATGPNVDVVCPDGAHVWLNAQPDQLFDVAISCECLEHDFHWPDTLRAMVRTLRPGGILTFTCATTGRPVHGTIDSTPSDAPGLPWNTYYKNLTEIDVRSVLDCEQIFSWHEFKIGYETCDLYFGGIKK